MREFSNMGPLFWSLTHVFNVIFSIFLVPCRLQDTPLHTHLQTADGMKPLAALKAVTLLGPLPVPACGTPLPVTHLLALPPLVGTLLATPRLATVEPQEAYARTAGTKPRRQKGRPRDTGVAGPKPHAQTEEMSRWARPRPQEPVRGSLGGMKPLPVRWDPQHHYLLQEKLPSERQLWTWLPQRQVTTYNV